MRNVVTPLVGLLLFAAAGWVAWRVLLPRWKDASRTGTPPPAEARVEGLPAEFVARVDGADDLQAADLLRLAKDRYTLPRQRDEFVRLRSRRRDRALLDLRAEVDRLLLESRCADAVRAVKRYDGAWGDTGLLAHVRAEQARIVDERLAEVDALVDAGRYVAAREACRPPDGLFEPSAEQRIREHAELVERRIRVRSYRPDRHPPVVDAGPAPAPTKAIPSSPPALPGAPHADVKRMGEARELLRRIGTLFRNGQYGPVTKAAADLLGFFGDLKMVARKKDGVQAVLAYARYKSMGEKGLFHATDVKMRGRAVQLTYRFESDGELADWESLKIIPHASSGQFDKARDGVRGTGVAGFALRAFFEDDAQLRAKSYIQQPRSHGLAFLEAGNEQRQVVLLATNHWFTEGENYVKKRPGHSILLIGKGVNNDVPIDSPEVGFVFKGASAASPSPPAGAELDLTLSIEKSQVKGVVRWRADAATLNRDARGDDGRGFRRHRPTLFVVEAGAIFREVVVRGTLHGDFVKERERELLDMAESVLQ